MLPPPKLTKNAFEVMVYLSYDRVGMVVEEAIRLLQRGGDTSSTTNTLETVELVSLTEPIPPAVYQQAVQRLPEVPEELVERERAAAATASVKSSQTHPRPKRRKVQTVPAVLSPGDVVFARPGKMVSCLSCRLRCVLVLVGVFTLCWNVYRARGSCFLCQRSC